MSARRRVDGDTGSSDPALSHALSRRGWLNATAAMTLAAGGLWLPAWLVEEAEADNHSADRIQESKARRKKHRRHHKRRRRDHGHQ